MAYRFAFDMGTNSLGWAVYALDANLDPSDLVDAGVRIFSDGRDPKSGDSLAVERRGPRSMRRRRDRYLQRRTYLMDILIKSGLMPSDEAERKALEKLDPYVLRAKGLDEKLTPYEFGRALFHLNQRRGFQSNRIADAGNDEESVKIKTATKKLLESLKEQNCRTYGEFLAKRQAAPKVRERQAVRIRLIGQGAKALYDFYPTRDIIKDEFEKLWTEQSKHHPDKLTPKLKEILATEDKSALFYQRPLKPPIVGKCTFYPDEYRLPKAHPLSQERRIYQDLNHLRLKEGTAPERPLSLDERDKLAFTLLAGEDVTFKSGFRKLLRLPANTVISLEENGKRDHLIGNQLVSRLSGKKGPLTQIWGNLTPEQRADIALKLNTEQQEKPLIAYLMATYGLSETVAKATANIRLPDGYDSLGETATRGIVAELKKAVIPYSEAVKKMGLHHSDERDGVSYDQLPPYPEILQRHTLGGTGDPKDPPEKRYGRIANPTVHVGLNQLRRVTNALLKLYGNPEQIVVELARDLKMSKKQKDDLAKENKVNEDKNKDRVKKIEAEGFESNPNNLRLMRLWEELGDLPRHCVYTGRVMSLEDVLSDRVEVEHILPYSRTLDDSMANKTLAFRDANRYKRNQTPSEAFSGAEYQAIRERAQGLPKNKRWRFEPNAMEKYEKEEGGFAARQLNDTRHMGVIAKKLLTGALDDPNKSVWVVTGQLTALLRQRFGLNSILSDHNQKNRFDHRHHAIDATVIGICDPRLLQRMANESKKHENNDALNDITRHVPEPFPDFRAKVKAKINAIIVSHKAEHGTGGALHEGTSYGINAGSDKDEGDLITRKAIDALSPPEVDKVRDLWLREKLQAIKAYLLTMGLSKTKFEDALKKALADFGESQSPPIRRVRILKKQEDFIPIKSRKTGKPYRAVIAGENHHADIIEDSKGKWRGYSVSIFDANQKNNLPPWKAELPDGKLIMRLHKGDLVEILDDDGIRHIKKVVVLDLSACRVRLADHNESGKLQKRHEDPDDLFRWDLATISKLKERNCKLYKTDELGKPRKIKSA